MGSRKTNEEFLREVYEKNEYVRRGEIEILSEYVGVDTKIKCRCVKHNWIYWVAPSSLLNNIGCKKCGRERTTEKQTKSHERFIAEVYILDSSITVLGHYVNAFTPIDFMCSKGHVWSMKPIDFLNGYRCPYCSNRRVLIGYNDIATTRPDVFALLTDPEDGYKYTSGSSKKVNFTCPLCGKVQKKQIGLVSERGFSCTNCSDHLSYPSRFGRALFDQLPVSYYDTEWQPDWAKPYFYDLHFELGNKHFIVEWDGAFHFDEDDKFGISLEERQERDKIKNELAYEHNVYMIRIDCIKSMCDYIKTNIMQSKLSTLFDLSNVDWKLCDEKAQKSLVKEVCDLYVSNVKYSEIAKKVHLSESTVRVYVKKGVKFGWCQYDSEKEQKDLKTRHGFVTSVKIIDTGKEYVFNSMYACEQWMKNVHGIYIDCKIISRCSSSQQPYKGFYFNIVEQTT